MADISRSMSSWGSSQADAELYGTAAPSGPASARRSYLTIWSGDLTGSPLSQSAVAPRASFGDQRAPLSVQDVEQVLVTPLSQAMHTATHCFMFLDCTG